MDKQELRERVWNSLEESGEARFPFPPRGRIPNFAGAEEAAELLARQEEWRSAEVLKANPDSPQLPVRRRALREGKTVYMAVPRLTDERPFVELDPGEIDDARLDSAATVSSYASIGELVYVDEVREVDLVVTGCVAVSVEGTRVGKGEGYSDLEWALLREAGAVDGSTPVATTVHELQVLEEEEVASRSHDVTVDLVATPERLLRTGASSKPRGIDRDLLTEEQIRDIPALSCDMRDEG